VKTIAKSGPGGLGGVISETPPATTRTDMIEAPVLKYREARPYQLPPQRRSSGNRAYCLSTSSQYLTVSDRVCTHAINGPVRPKNTLKKPYTSCHYFPWLGYGEWRIRIRDILYYSHIRCLKRLMRAMPPVEYDLNNRALPKSSVVAI
jgi:hypothetical protein